MPPLASVRRMRGCLPECSLPRYSPGQRSLTSGFCRKGSRSEIRALNMVAQMNAEGFRRLHEYRRVHGCLPERDSARSDWPHESRLPPCGVFRTYRQWRSDRRLSRCSGWRTRSATIQQTQSPRVDVCSGLNTFGRSSAIKPARIMIPFSFKIRLSSALIFSRTAAVMFAQTTSATAVRIAFAEPTKTRRS